MWKTKGFNFILFLVISLRFSNGAFIPFEEDQPEKSEENGKVCCEHRLDTFQKDFFSIAALGAFATPTIGGFLAATGNKNIR